MLLFMVLMIGQTQSDIDAKNAFAKATRITFAQARAKSEIPIICFVGVKERPINGVTVVYEDTLKDWPKCIIVAVPTKEGWDAYEMPIIASDTQLRERVRLGQEREARRRLPDPFQQENCST